MTNKTAANKMSPNIQQEKEAGDKHKMQNVETNAKEQIEEEEHIIITNVQIC